MQGAAPEVAAVEQLFFSTNRRTAMRVSEARGVVICALAREGVTVAEYTPTQVKEAVCGYGAARKPQVARMVANLLGCKRFRVTTTWPTRALLRSAITIGAASAR